MSVAALRELRRIFPEDRLTLLARDWVAEVFNGQGLVDKIISFPDRGASLGSLRRQIRGQQAAVLFPNAFRSALLTFLARIPRRIGYGTDGRSLLLTTRARPRIRQEDRHQVYYYLDLLFQTGLSGIDYLRQSEFHPDISLRPTAEGIEKAAALLSGRDGSPLVGVNPGAYFGPAKRWQTERYAAVCDRLIEEKGARILIFGSPGELRIAREISDFMRFEAEILAGRTDLEGLMALIAACDLFLTNDSGPMHLAAALGTPLLALFGSTDEVATGPFTERAHVIHKHVECSPCLRRECPIDLRCFTRISVDEVFDRACRMLPS